MSRGGVGTRSPERSIGVRNPGLDRLRGLAVLLVLAYHAWPDTVPGGLIGVDLFFVLSGYLVTVALLRAPREWSRFWVRRIRRLVPALVVVLPLGTALTLLLAPAIPAKLPLQWAGALTFTSNWLYAGGEASYFARFDPPWWLHLWSLGVEAQFYLIWPLLLALLWVLTARMSAGVRRRVLMTVAFALAGASAAGLILGAQAGAEATSLYMNTVTHVFGVMAGAGVALLLDTGGSAHPQRLRQTRSGRISALLPLIGASLGVVALLTIGLLLPADSDPQALAWGLPQASAVGAMTVACVAVGRESRPARSPGPMQWLGARSYAVYLWHWPLLLTMRGLVPQRSWEVDLLFGIAMMVLSGLIAELSWRWVEKPVLTRGFRSVLDEVGQVSRRWAPWRLLLVSAAAVLIIVAVASALILSPARSPLEMQLGGGR